MSDYLAHYGVKGMKWGVRRTAEELGSKLLGKKHDDYKKAHTRKSVRSMSTQELRDRTNRLQAENQYRAAKRSNSASNRAVTSFIKTASLITAGVAAYKVYEKHAKNLISKASDKIVPNFVIDNVH